jgi:hypothetical protein
VFFWKELTTAVPDNVEKSRHDRQSSALALTRVDNGLSGVHVHVRRSLGVANRDNELVEAPVPSERSEPVGLRHLPSLGNVSGRERQEGLIHHLLCLTDTDLSTTSSI